MKRPTTPGQRLWQATRTLVTATAVAAALAACGGGESRESSESDENGDSGDTDAARDACHYFRTEVIEREIDPEAGYEELFDELEGDLSHMQSFAYGTSDPLLFSAVQGAISQTIVTKAQAQWANTVEVIEAAREAGIVPSGGTLTLDEALDGLDAAGDNLDRAIEAIDSACDQADS